jgi:hypothetical protein
MAAINASCFHHRQLFTQVQTIFDQRSRLLLLSPTSSARDLRISIREVLQERNFGADELPYLLHAKASEDNWYMTNWSPLWMGELIT